MPTTPVTNDRITNNQIDTSRFPQPIEIVPISSIQLDPRNARRHPDKNLSQIRRSLREFGQQKPIVVRDNTVIAGNGTLEAAIAEGWTHIAIVRSLLTPPAATAYGMADNKTGESSEWDFEVAAELLQELKEVEFDVTATGFEEHEIDTIIAAEWTPPAPKPKDLEPQHNANHAKPIHVTPAMRETIDRAIEAIREEVGQPEMTEGRAIELMSADWLSRR